MLYGIIFINVNITLLKRKIIYYDNIYLEPIGMKNIICKHNHNKILTEWLYFNN